MNDSNDFRIPGQLIQALLDKRGWSKRTLAVVLDVGESTVTKIASGKQDVDAAMALVLEEVFGESAERFLALQTGFDLAKARILVKPDPDRANRAALYGDLPVAEMIRRGWIKAESVRDKAAVQSELMRFFGVNPLEGVPKADTATAMTIVPHETVPNAGNLE